MGSTVMVSIETAAAAIVLVVIPCATRHEHCHLVHPLYVLERPLLVVATWCSWEGGGGGLGGVANTSAVGAGTW